MITVITGRPGGGKTYESVRYHIIPALQDGRKVITNVPLNVDYICKIYGEDKRSLIDVRSSDFSDFEGSASVFPFSRPSHYQDDWKDENGRGALFVVDEAHFSIPKGGTFPDVKKYYTMHRHYGVDILLMTQHPRQLDADILNLVEVVYRCIKNTAMGSSKTYTKKVQDGYRGDVVNTSQRKYDSKIFKFYKSHTQSSKSVLESSARDIVPLWKRWPILGAVIILPISFYALATVDSPLNPDPKPLKQTQIKVVDGKRVAETVEITPSPKKDYSKTPERVERDSSNLKSRSDSSSFPIEHPLHKVNLHVVGSYYTSPDKSDYRVTFSASRNGQAMFKLDDLDLIRAGYSVYVLSDCSVYIEWNKYKEFLTCDVPSVGVTTLSP
jgi:zona occludens toxin